MNNTKNIKTIVFSLLICLFILIPLVFSPVNFSSFELPKLMVISVISLIILILSMIILYKDKALNLELQIFSVLGVLVFFLLVTIPRKDINFTLFVQYLPSIAIIIPLGLLSEKESGKIIYGIGGAIFFVSIYGILQSFGIDFQFWGGNIGKKEIFSTIGNPNNVADLVFFLVPLFFFYLSKRDNKTKFSKVFFGLLILLSIVLGFITLSKGSILSFFSALIIIVLLGFINKKLQRTRKLIVLIIPIIILFALSLIILKDLTPGTFIKRYSMNGSPVKNRFFIYKTTLHIIKNNPVTGIGPGKFRNKYINTILENDSIRKNSVDPSAVLVKRVHNEFLQASCDFGIPGFILFVMFWIILFLTLFKLSHNLNIFIFILWSFIFLFFESFINFPFQNPTLFLMIILLISSVLKNLNLKLSIPGWIKTPAMVVIVIFLVISNILNIKIFISDYFLQQANKSFSRENIPETKIYLTKAIDAYTSNGIAIANLGNIYMLQGNYIKAEKFLLKSQQYYIDHQVFLSLGNLYFTQGKKNEAKEYYGKSLKLNPYSDIVLFQYAKILYFNGDYMHAFRELQKIGSNRTDAEFNLLSGLIQQKLNKRAYLNNLSEAFIKGTPGIRLEILKKIEHPKDFIINMKPHLRSDFDILLYAGTLLYSGEPEEASALLRILNTKETDSHKKDTYSLILLEINKEYQNIINLTTSNEKSPTLQARLMFKTGNFESFRKILNNEPFDLSMPFYHERIEILKLFDLVMRNSSMETIKNQYKKCYNDSPNSPLLSYFPVFFNYYQNQFYAAYKHFLLIYPNKYLENYATPEYLSLYFLFTSYNKKTFIQDNNPLMYEFYLLNKFSGINSIEDKILFTEFKKILELKYPEKKAIIKKTRNTSDLERFLISEHKLQEGKEGPALDLALLYMLQLKNKECQKLLSTLPNHGSYRHKLIEGLNLWNLTGSNEPPDVLIQLSDEKGHSQNIYVLFANHIIRDTNKYINEELQFEQLIK